MMCSFFSRKVHIRLSHQILKEFASMKYLRRALKTSIELLLGVAVCMRHQENNLLIPERERC